MEIRNVSKRQEPNQRVEKQLKSEQFQKKIKEINLFREGTHCQVGIFELFASVYMVSLSLM